ncbi:phospholipase C/P1 nuclease [Fistulina hepatica ATCC 64428]|uniref:Phospholipase C/P1 nuclease n=1 Tax=Fistulina hepatica ATCC 64428 TaxID=1128425 RepID=A0A0D7ADK5_9AGAR|nr:phospholipase C/P1 nuclease [Fistulina hepatica ATCC 64428]
MRISKLLYIGGAIISHAAVASAWGAAGHEIVATIAQMYIHPNVLPTICDILNYTSPDPAQPQCHLAPIAAWADRIRYSMRWSASLHYIGARGDHPSDLCLFPGKDGWEGKPDQNVLAAIDNTTGLLRDWADHAESDETANEALKFLVHFLGDMHMPLHLTGRDRGGNSDKVLFDGRKSNLHSVWDNLLIAKALRTIPRNYTTPLPVPEVEHNLRGAIYDPYIRRIMWQGVLGKWEDELEDWVTCWGRDSIDVAPGQQQVLGSSNDKTTMEESCQFYWASPIHTLNCDIIWPKALDEPPYASGRLVERDEHQEHADHECSAMSIEDALRLVGDEASVRGGRRKDDPEYLELDTPEYAGVIYEQWIIEKLLAQAGLRLAVILNTLFADVDAIAEIRARTHLLSGSA